MQLEFQSYSVSGTPKLQSGKMWVERSHNEEIMKGDCEVHGWALLEIWGPITNDIMRELTFYPNVFSGDLPVSTRHKEHQGRCHRESDIEVWL